jgi:hypothetical protein
MRPQYLKRLELELLREGKKSQFRAVRRTWKCPYSVGDVLWVQEKWAPGPDCIRYELGGEPLKVQHKLPEGNGQWRPAKELPQWAARYFLKVLEVREERLQEISEEDAAAEGFKAFDFVPQVHPISWTPFGTSPSQPAQETQVIRRTARELFRLNLWPTDYLWESNPRVWAVRFELKQRVRKLGRSS